MAASNHAWEARKRKYEQEKQEKAVDREVTTSHPLKAITVTVSEAKSKKGGKQNAVSQTKTKAQTTPMFDPLSSAMEGSDPLSQMAAEIQDPLSQLSLSHKNSASSNIRTMSEDMDETFEPWSTKRPAILAKFTTSEKLSITTSFLSASDKEKVVTKAQQATVSDKVKNRLEQLDDFEEGSVQEMLNLSQQEYVNRIEELNTALIQAWDQDQRVKSLKIAIQCAKLLADVSVIQFYPSKFVLVTDILDTFGRLVYDRIKAKAEHMSKSGPGLLKLGDNFTPDQVPEAAKETCRNWFFKIASIRELIPRFYVEAAILKCYSFLNVGEYNQALVRLSHMTHGVGDPLVAIYIRCYLCRVGIEVAPKIRDHLVLCFDDFLTTYSQLQSETVKNLLSSQNLDFPKYFTLYSPALDWILQCLAHDASEKVLAEVMEKCRKQCNSALLLNSVMSAFKPEYISSRAVMFTEMIKECEETGLPKYFLYRSLGTCLALASPPESDQLPLLNDVWKVVTKFKSPGDYMLCSEVWIEYVVKHFGKRELNTILGDILKHMTPDRAFEDYYAQLQSVMSKILAHLHNFSDLFSMDKFLPFLDIFQKDSVKVEVCKNIMEFYTKHQTEPTSDPVITNALMFISKTMHDSVNALTLEDDVRIIGNLIIGFIRSVSFGRDFEQQLNFYVECRASFSNIDAVLTFLVHSVNKLSVDTRKIVKGSHSRKTAGFVRACAAYSFITIPSLHDIFSQLNLYLISGHVALINGCLSQGDAFFKAAVSLIPEVPHSISIDGKMRSTEQPMTDFLNSFVGSLLIIPDSPDQGVLYFVRGFLNVINSYQWDPRSDAKVTVYVNMLCMLSAMCQEHFIHHIDKVDSNDTLYGHDKKFIGEVQQVCATLLEEILAHLKYLEKYETAKRQSQLSLDLFNRIIAHGDLGNPKMSALAINLWNLAQKNGHIETKLMVRCRKYVAFKGRKSDGQLYEELVSKMNLQSRA